MGGRVVGGLPAFPSLLERVLVSQVPLGLLGMWKCGVGSAPRNAGWLQAGCGADDAGFWTRRDEPEGDAPMPPPPVTGGSFAQTTSSAPTLTPPLAGFNGIDGMQEALLAPPAGVPRGIFNLHLGEIQPESAPTLPAVPSGLECCTRPRGCARLFVRDPHR